MPTPAVLLLLALVPIAALSAEKHRPFIDEAEPVTPSSIQEGEVWKEGKAALPPWPKDGDLIEFRLDGDDSSLRYSIDGKHLTVGADGGVRYTLVVQSRGGARNVSFEGLRCTPKGAYKVYAYGTGDAFKPAPEGDWQPIREHGYDKYHRELHGHFLCVPLKFEPRPTNDMLRALRGPINPRQNTGFMPD